MTAHITLKRHEHHALVTDLCAVVEGFITDKEEWKTLDQFAAFTTNIYVYMPRAFKERLDNATGHTMPYFTEKIALELYSKLEAFIIGLHALSGGNIKSSYTPDKVVKALHHIINERFQDVVEDIIHLSHY